MSADDYKTSPRAVGERIEFLRKAKGIDSRELFLKILGIKKARYNNWAAGLQMVPWPMAIEISKITGAGIDFIYLGKMSDLPSDFLNLYKEMGSPGEVEPPSCGSC